MNTPEFIQERLWTPSGELRDITGTRGLDSASMPTTEYPKVNSTSTAPIALPFTLIQHLRELHGADLRTLVALSAQIPNQDQNTRNLAEAAGISTRAVFKSLNVLDRLGLIRRDANGRWVVNGTSQARAAVPQPVPPVPSRPEEEGPQLVRQLTRSAAPAKLIDELPRTTGRNWSEIVSILKELRDERALFDPANSLLTAMVMDRLRGIGRRR